MNRLSNDAFYDVHLVFDGVYWEEEVVLPTAWAELTGRTTHTRHVGGDDVRDEMLTLELGAHVEMECALQDMAAGGCWAWDSLGQYLAGLLDTAEAERGEA